MRDFLSRFSLEAVKFNPQVWACAIVLYLVVIGCTLHSIHTQPFNKKMRTIWTVVVIFAPIIGLAVYAMACVLYATSETKLMAKPK